MRRLILLLSLLLASSAHACKNDRDSDYLAAQAQKIPGVLSVITGRFDHNPPLFYQMRIKREAAQLEKTPRQFGLYDDVAVALDRLGRDKESLRIMKRKRAALPAYDSQNPIVKEAWYRYFSNNGTFLAHHWLATGAKLGRIDEVEKGCDFIRRAIQINPDAHFGCDKYQLLEMQWMIERQKGKSPEETLYNWIEKNNNWFYNVADGEMAKVTSGLATLIVLDDGWQSPDMLQALAGSLKREGGLVLCYVALSRCRELLRAGQKSFAPQKLGLAWIDHRMASIGYRTYIHDIPLHKQFPHLLAEGEQWSVKRTAYMLPRLRQGRHPDTDPAFWRNWHPAPAPMIDTTEYHYHHARDPFGEIGGTLIVTSLAIFFFVGLAAVVSAILAERPKDKENKSRGN